MLARPLLLTALAAIAACGNTVAATGVTPVTGIVIRSDSLISGIGCGTGPQQVRKFAAFVASDDDLDGGAIKRHYLYATTFDCFADGVFSSIPLPASGNRSFTVDVLAFDAIEYGEQRAAVDGAPAPFDPMADPEHLNGVYAAAKPTWTTSCHATQQANIAVLAVCAPLAPHGAPRIRLDTQSFARAGGGVLTCNQDFDTVRAFFNELPNDSGDIACPSPYIIDPAKASTPYVFDVFLTKHVTHDGGAPTIETVAIAKGCAAPTGNVGTTAPACPPAQ